MAYRALCRVLEARAGLVSVAFYERQGPIFVLRYATEAYRAFMEPDAVTLRFKEELSEFGVQRLVPDQLGLGAAASLIHPFRDGNTGAICGLIAVACRRERRIGARIAEALKDAAEIAAHLPKGLHTEPAAPAALLEVKDEPEEAPGQGEDTGLTELSRAAVHQLIASLLRAQSRGERLAFAVLDIDRFRAVNEALGTEAGDLTLAATAGRIEACLEPQDRLVRLERDRFLIVTSPARRDVRMLGEMLLVAVAEPLELPTRRVTLRASVGVVLARHAESSPVRLLMQADTALRQAKAAGGSRVKVHEPGTHAALLEQSMLELDLRHALDGGELSLAYQPYVDLATGTASGVEALLRWSHPTRGEIAPATFIPLAEATGQILPIGMWALQTACTEAIGWEGNFMLSVNISPLQFHAPGFVGEVEAVLAATGFPAERLELEITETVLMRDNPETISQLQALIARGIRIALDDFGTGYSALAYLSRLPHHRIKLDKSFVQDMGRPSTAGLIQAIIALARAGGISITAEGVERPEQLQSVKAMGFTHAQGFATGLPLRGQAALGEAVGTA